MEEKLAVPEPQPGETLGALIAEVILTGSTCGAAIAADPEKWAVAIADRTGDPDSKYPQLRASKDKADFVKTWGKGTVEDQAHRRMAFAVEFARHCREQGVKFTEMSDRDICHCVGQFYDSWQSQRRRKGPKTDPVFERIKAKYPHESPEAWRRRYNQIMTSI